MSTSLRNKTISRMNLLKVSPKRSLGQNFLISEQVVERILKAACPLSFDKVFEIGPGLGALTEPLEKKSRELILVELDKRFCDFWCKQGFGVKQVDALDLDWSEHFKTHESCLLVSNLPYQIASRCVVEFSKLEKSFDRMVLMFQKEVSQRILAKPGTHEYGFLTVVARAFWDIHLVLEAGTVDFFPRPRVASQVLCFDRKKQMISQEDAKCFFEVVKQAFISRRKKLFPKLKSYIDKNRLPGILKEMNLSDEVRAENLSPEQFIKLTVKLRKGWDKRRVSIGNPKQNQYNNL